MLRILISLCCGLLCYPVLLTAQTNSSSSMPTDDQITEQRNKVQSILEEADELLNSEELPQSLAHEQKLMQQIETDGLRGFLKGITENPDLRSMPEFLDAAMAAGESEAFSTSSTNYNPMNPIVMISFSMPSEQLTALIKGAHHFGAAVYLRGFLENDVNKTIDKLIELSADNDYSLSIDPTLFTRFDVESVPTFILPLEPIIPCDDSGCSEVKHVRASGSVSLEYFLDLVVRTGTEEEKAVATKSQDRNNEG